MLAPHRPATDAQRLACLYSYEVLDTESDSVFDDLTKLAAKMTSSPIAVVSLVDKDRQWFKSKVNLDALETSRDISFCGHALANPSQMMIVPDATQDVRFADNPLVTGAPNIRFYAGVPLVSPEGHALGTLCVLDHVPREMLAEQQEVLTILGRAVMTTLELGRNVARARKLALTDPLTGLANRRAFSGAVERAQARQARDGGPFGLVYIDLDGFKAINDTFGHDVGDQVLQEVATTLLHSVRRDDLVVRLGGDEFAVLLTGNGIAAIAESIREAIEHQMQSWGWPVTASVGAVSFQTPPSSEADAMALADMTMYAAKTGGKNCTRYREIGARACLAMSPGSSDERFGDALEMPILVC